MEDAHSAERIRRTYQALRPEMDERMRRQWAAAEARGLGYGGIASVSRTTGLSRTTIAAGLAELDLHPTPRRRAASADPARPRTAPRAGVADRADDARRPGIDAALDL